MNQYIPPIGTAGLYHLDAPFATLLIADLPYTCIGVRKLSDILAAGGNPLKDYYQSNSLTVDKFNEDYANDVCILSLQCSNGALLYVPTSFVLSYPDIGGVPYSTLALAISIGIVPDTLNLSYLQSKIVDDVRDIVGIDAVVNVVAISPPTLLSYDDSKAIEAARVAKITTTVTDYSKYLETLALLETARLKITELENYIIAHR